MKVRLMQRDRGFDPQICGSSSFADLVKDLQLDLLFDAMAVQDTFLREIARAALLASLCDPHEITYRQEVLTDCLEQPEIIRGLYNLAAEAIEGEKKIWGFLSSRYAEGALHRAIEVLSMFLGVFHGLREIVDTHEPKFRSRGFQRFFAMVREELDDTYLATVGEHLKELEFRGGVLISAELGLGGKGSNYTLRKHVQNSSGWWDRLQEWTEELFTNHEAPFIYEVDPRDQAGASALAELKVQGIRDVARALAQSTDHILSFFKELRTELGFYIGCLNLHERLAQKQEPVCFPEPLPPVPHELQCRGLYDVCLSLNLPGRTVGNDIAATGKPLIVITGANQGGKSTFLRSAGIAQLMMQCGMFVPAHEFRASVCTGVYTHFKREEDVAMKSGKLDEELARMNAIVDELRPGGMVLLNESFASTNEREGAEIAGEIVRALLESRVKVFCVTHMFELSDGLYQANRTDALFLRAERLSDETRTFRLIEGLPLPTSYGADLYLRIFCDGPRTEQNAVEYESSELGAL